MSVNAMSVDQDIAILEQVPMLRVLGRGTLRCLLYTSDAADEL